MDWGQQPQRGYGGSPDGWSSAAGSSAAQPGADGFDRRPEIILVAPERPPLIWLAVGFVLTVAAAAVAAIGQSATTGLVGWVLAGPLAISTVALFITQDAKRRESGWYAPSLAAEWGRRVLIVLALLAVTFCAWYIANDVARGVWR